MKKTVLMLASFSLIVLCTMYGAAEKIPYRSTYNPTHAAKNLLKSGKIISSSETPQEMMERVVTALFSVESKFNTDKSEIQRLSCDFGKMLDEGYCVMSTPILTNAGRYYDKPLSACTVPVVDLRADMAKIKTNVERLHEDGMGTGFNLDQCENPVSILRALNKIAVDGAKSDREDRPVGNIAVLSINHPKIEEFIDAKIQVNTSGEEWKFNISVNIDDKFMKAYFSNDIYQLSNGKIVSAKYLLEKIAHSAYICGDPGIIFLDRINQGNPTPAIGTYLAVAPCGEVGLAAGESCQFGYINVSKFFIKKEGQQIIFDFDTLKKTTQLLVRALDNALEISIDCYAFEEQKEIMRAKRKIGIGICGLADLLVSCGFSYADPEARALAQDIVAFINYHSKVASHELAKTRGSFGAMYLERGCRYNEIPGYIEQQSGRIATKSVSLQMWQELANTIRETKLLRNASTIALPPTGRSAVLIDASWSIEPLFSLVTTSSGSRELNTTLEKVLKDAGLMSPELRDKILSCGGIGNIPEIPKHIRDVFKTASELSPEEHLAMIESLQEVIDESISKTINVAHSASEQDILEILCQAYRKGLKGITIYRNGSRTMQPHELSTSK